MHSPSALSPSMPRPVILISADLAEGAERGLALRCNYVEAVVEAGGTALVVPPEPAQLADALAVAGGVLVSGSAPGVAVDAARHAFDRALIRAAMAAGKPVLGICHGMQVIGEVLGGRVLRDDPALMAADTPHLPQPVPDALAHPVEILPGSLLSQCHDGGPAMVNSLHRHRLAEDGGFRIAARAPDGVIEAIEGPGFCLGVQWHPEYRLTGLDRAIFAAFVDACRPRVGAVAERLAILGLTLPEAPEPPGSFCGAVRHGRVVTVSGQVPLQDGRVLQTGRLGEGVSLEDGCACARAALMNALAQLDRTAGGLDRVAGFVRLAGYVAATPGFTTHGAVVEAASALLKQLFPDRWQHARVALGVASLPRGVPVEIEISAVLQGA